MERAAAARLALNPHPSAHQLDKAQRDGKPETGTAVASRGRAVGLCERVENMSLLLGRDADSRIGHDKVQRHDSGAGRLDVDAELDFAAARELDGIADDVQEHLPEPSFVAEQGLGHIGRDVARQLDVLLGGAHAEQPRRIFHAVPEIEFGPLEIEPAGLDLGEVEHVIDDLEQRFGRRLDGG